nr:MAG: hypothetical protein [Bee densovirus 9]
MLTKSLSAAMTSTTSFARLYSSSCILASASTALLGCPLSKSFPGPKYLYPGAVISPLEASTMPATAEPRAVPTAAPPAIAAILPPTGPNEAPAPAMVPTPAAPTAAPIPVFSNVPTASADIVDPIVEVPGVIPGILSGAEGGLNCFGCIFFISISLFAALFFEKAFLNFS